jgi:restriction system protein
LLYATIIDFKIRCLANYLNVDHRIFRPVVVFKGDCKFKSSMPVNVMKSGLASYIKSSKTPRLDCECLAWIEEKLRELKDLAGLTTDAHLASLASRFEPETILHRG